MVSAREYSYLREPTTLIYKQAKKKLKNSFYAKKLNDTTRHLQTFNQHLRRQHKVKTENYATQERKLLVV